MRRMTLWVSGFAIIVFLSCGGGGRPAVEEDAQNDGPLPDDILTEEQDVPVAQDKEDVLDVDVVVDLDALVEEDDEELTDDIEIDADIGPDALIEEDDDAVTDDDTVDQDAVVYPDFEKQDCSGIAPSLTATFSLSALSYVSKVAFKDRHAYLYDFHNRLLVVDLLDPVSPTIVRTVDVDISIRDMVVSGDHLYVVNYPNGLLVYDLSAPTDPQLVGNVYFPGVSRELKSNGTVVAIKVDHIVQDELLLIDVSVPEVPFVMAESLLSDVYDFAFAGDLLYISLWSNTNALRVVDLSLPFSPAVEFASLSSSAEYTKLATEGNTLFIAKEGAFKMYDIADRLAPQLVGSGSYEAAFHDGLDNIVPASPLVYLSGADMGYAVMDISDPSQPKLTFSDRPGIVLDIFAQENGYTIAGEIIGLRAYTNAFPAPEPIGELAPFITADVVTNGNYAYVSGYNGGMAVLNLSDPQAPQVSTRYDDLEGTYGLLALSGDALTLIAADMFKSELVFFSLADPQVPEEQKRLSIAPIQPADMVAQGNQLYVVDYKYGITPINIVDPQNIGTIYMNNTQDIAVSGTILLTARDEGILVQSIAENLIPSYLGELALPGAADVAASGSTVYVRDNDDVLHIIDIADASNPLEKNTVPLSRQGATLSAEGSFLFVANYRYDMTDISIPRALPLPELLGLETLNLLGMTPHAAVGSQFIFLTGTEDIKIFDTSVPPTDVPLHFTPIPEGNHRLFQRNGYLYLPTEGTLKVFSLTDPDEPTEVGASEQATLFEGEIVACGNRLFLSKYIPNFEAIHQFDISAPAAPIYKSTKDLSVVGTGIACVANHLYVSTQQGTLLIYETSDSGFFSQKGELVLTGILQSLAVSGDTLFVLTQDRSLISIDISDRNVPVVIQEIALPWKGQRISIGNGFAAITMPYAGVAFVDVSNPADLRLDGIYRTVLTSSAIVAISKEIAVVSENSMRGQRVLDVSDRAHPRLISAGTYSDAADTVIYAGRLYTLSSEPGLLVAVKPLLCQ